MPEGENVDSRGHFANPMAEISGVGLLAVRDAMLGEGYTKPMKDITAVIFEDPAGWGPAEPVYQSEHGPDKPVFIPKELDQCRAGRIQEMSTERWRLVNFKDAVMQAEGKTASNIQGLLMSSKSAKDAGDLDVAKAIYDIALKMHPGLKNTITRLKNEGLDGYLLIREAASQCSYSDLLTPAEKEFGLCKANGVEVKVIDNDFHSKKNKRGF